MDGGGCFDSPWAEFGDAVSVASVVDSVANVIGDECDPDSPLCPVDFPDFYQVHAHVSHKTIAAVSTRPSNHYYYIIRLQVCPITSARLRVRGSFSCQCSVHAYN